MTTRRVVVRTVRILVLLQRKTLIETKNRTLKCLKWNQAHGIRVRGQFEIKILTVRAIVK